MFSLLCLFFFLCLPAASATNVAIIGSGISGSLLSFYLTTPSTIYERSEVVGGRVKSTQILVTHAGVSHNITVELGASVAYSGNTLISTISDDLNLAKRTPREDQPSSTLSIFADKSLVFSQFPTPLVPVLLLSLFNKLYTFSQFYSTFPALAKLANNAASSLDQLYASFAATQADFRTPAALWDAIGLGKYLSIPFAALYHDEVSATETTLLNTLSAAITRNNCEWNAATHMFEQRGGCGVRSTRHSRASVESAERESRF